MKDIPTVTAYKKCLDKHVTKSIYADRLFIAARKSFLVNDSQGMNIFWSEAEEELIDTVMEFSQEKKITIDNLDKMPGIDS